MKYSLSLLVNLKKMTVLDETRAKKGFGESQFDFTNPAFSSDSEDRRPSLTSAGLKMRRTRSVDPENGKPPCETNQLNRKAGRSARDIVRKKVPVLNIPAKYTPNDFWGDFVAGIFTAGIPSIPQGIIYAEIANVPIQYGLYAGFMGPFIYAIFGNCKEMHVGPVAAIAVLIGSVTSNTSQRFAVIYSTLLCFTFGIFSFLLGLFRLGWLADLVGVPVTSALVSAAAIIVMVCNVKTFLGLSDLKGQNLVELLPQMYNNLYRWKYGDVICGVGAVLLLHAFLDSPKIKWEKIIPVKWIYKPLNMFFKAISVGRTPIVTTICGYAAYFSNVGRPEQIVTTAKAVDELGIPSPRIPIFFLPERNETINGNVVTLPSLSYFDIIAYGGFEPLCVSLVICLVQQALIRKHYAKSQPADVNHELMSLGVIQVASSFFGSMPVTGAFIRSAGMANQGVRTKFGVIWAGLMVLFALHVLTPYVEYDPKPSLAAIVFCGVFHLIQRDDAMRIWKTKRADMIPFAATFISSLTLGLTTGFCIGVTVNIAVLLLIGLKPRTDIVELDNAFMFASENIQKPEEAAKVVIMRPDRSLHLGGVEIFREEMCEKVAMMKESLRTVGTGTTVLTIIVDCMFVADMDYTAAKRLGSTVKALKAESNVKVMFVNVREAVDVALKGAADGNVDTFPVGTEPSLSLAETSRSKKSGEQIDKLLAILDETAHGKTTGLEIAATINEPKIDEDVFSGEQEKPMKKLENCDPEAILEDEIQKNEITKF